MDTTAPTVAILGGGIGGLSAAHELAERGFDVSIYEANDRFGGKARTIPAAFDDSRLTLPSEHGFRFFPGFYRHITDTMKRIPDGEGSVYDNLVPTTETLIGSVTGSAVTSSTRTPKTPREWVEQLKPGIAAESLSGTEAGFFIERMFVLCTSCEDRLADEFEHITWWEFIDAERMSAAYRKNLGRSIRLLVALDPKRASARTVGRIYTQLLRGTFDPSLDAERILSGPTSTVWLDPWTDYLESLGVTLCPGTTIRHIACDGQRVTGVTVETSGENRKIEADYYVAALPVEVMAELVTDDLARAAPSLARIGRLETAWMNGIQFFLREDVPLAHGHQIYPDSPWALTSISQQQFWESYDLHERTDGAVSGVLSVIISDWNTPGTVHEKPAKECTPAEISEEVWTQLTAHLDRDRLNEANIHDWALDPAIVSTDDGVKNREPLLVNTVGSLGHRPEAGTELDNLVLAADYVRTNTDLASMEGANEAARRATNAILERADVRTDCCEVWDLAEPAVFEPLKAQDEIRYRLGLPHPGEARKETFRLVRRLRPRS
ncbi:MAG TPA: FAD-dependent oxidoreductase [Halococcus sp.]|nr:FAD-dependent oxidoreductase [Halococcus sp.]